MLAIVYNVFTIVNGGHMEEKIFYELKPFIEKLSRYYAKRFCVDRDDLFQEGSLGLILAVRRYPEKEKKELTKIAGRVINRQMYSFVRKELASRDFVKRALEEDYYEDRG